MSPTRALYLTYDGLTDPLGQSQILPYLRGLSERGHRITVISSEKPAAFTARGSFVRTQLQEYGLEWVPLKYHKTPPVLSSVWDIYRMTRIARELHAEKGFHLVHCRSYLPALVGLLLKRKYGLRFVFDMRGFWADERVDGGLWDPRRFPYNLVYRYFKRKERDFLRDADAVISLTHAAKEEMGLWTIPGFAISKVTVIPCCCDEELFCSANLCSSSVTELRSSLGLDEKDFVLGYLGSLGTWYMLDEMLSFFLRLLSKRPNAKFLFIVNDLDGMIQQRAVARGISLDSIRIVRVQRQEVPVALALTNVGLSFIRPTYSKMSSSPTKLAETLCMGIPMVSNAGVGDSDRLHGHYQIGPMIREFSDDEYDRAIAQLPKFLDNRSGDIRKSAIDLFSLKTGVNCYNRVYEDLN